MTHNFCNNIYFSRSYIIKMSDKRRCGSNIIKNIGSAEIHIFTKIISNFGVVANVLDCDVISYFIRQSRKYVQLWTNTLDESLNIIFSMRMG